jgi:hypothetical protein
MESSVIHRRTRKKARRICHSVSSLVSIAYGRFATPNWLHGRVQQISLNESKESLLFNFLFTALWLIMMVVAHGTNGQYALLGWKLGGVD